MNILAIGDVVGSIGCKFLRAHLPQLKKVKGVDLVIANGENSADGNGITPTSARFLFDSGVDVITAGNHTFRRKESYELFDSCETLLRPANFPSLAPGRGFCVVEWGASRVYSVGFMESMDSPSTLGPHPAESLRSRWSICTRKPLGKRPRYYLDGRVSAVFNAYASNSGRRYFRQRHRLYLRPEMRIGPCRRERTNIKKCAQRCRCGRSAWRLSNGVRSFYN
ncbi:MAG: YmdB family metallophosphoesterase [Anaeromassilibacillus sp.]